MEDRRGGEGSVSVSVYAGVVESRESRRDSAQIASKTNEIPTTRCMRF